MAAQGSGAPGRAPAGAYGPGGCRGGGCARRRADRALRRGRGERARKNPNKRRLRERVRRGRHHVFSFRALPRRARAGQRARTHSCVRSTGRARGCRGESTLARVACARPGGKNGRGVPITHVVLHYILKRRTIAAPAAARARRTGARGAARRGRGAPGGPSAYGGRPWAA
ncbi:MAG: hypothetical protein J3K34DRAFT_417556 [Monoraphidium minutum]|nr:MAG: hypothetical protein J3K34DRAFT_417556 [Monoraphidium minutum]